jgi:iron(III) transport system ATP-binding protein
LLQILDYSYLDNIGLKEVNGSQAPSNADLARFVGDAVLLPGVANNGYVTCVVGRLRLSPGVPEGGVEVLIRAERIQLLAETEAGVPARVSESMFYGHDATVSLSVFARRQLCMVLARVAGHAIPAPGAEVTVSVSGDVVAFPGGCDRQTL